MNDGDYLLQAILKDPLDEVTRLVFADWLDESGDHKSAGVHRRYVVRQAVLRSPEDDGPRLAYARVAEAYGDPLRAEFIRVQVELAEHFDPHEHAPRAEPLRRRERELLQAHWEKWFWLLSRRPGFGEHLPLRWWPVASNDQERAERGPNVPILSEAIEGEPKRGFIEVLRCSAADWLRHAEAILASQPLREVQLVSWPPEEYRLYWSTPNILERKWPLIKFTLPAAPNLQGYDAALEVVPGSSSTETR